MDFSTEAVARWCEQLPHFGRLRIEAGALVIERSQQAKSAADLLTVLRERQPGEALVVQRYPAHWLVTFSRTILPLDTPEQAC